MTRYLELPKIIPRGFLNIAHDTFVQYTDDKAWVIKYFYASLLSRVARRSDGINNKTQLLILPMPRISDATYTTVKPWPSEWCHIYCKNQRKCAVIYYQYLMFGTYFLQAYLCLFVLGQIAS